MQYKFLGKTGIKVSPLCFGTMTFGGEADETTSKKIFHRCRDAGINFFDCANLYQKGKSEEILGKLIADCRDEVIITSKVYFPTSKDVNAGGASRRHISLAVEASLKRLKTDHIDLYFIHRFDDRTDLQETLRALDDLVHQGKVIYIGASNFAAWQVAKSLGISEKFGWNKFACIQPMYNLLKRQSEVELFPMAQSENLGVVSYSPLGGGLLTGKYQSPQKPKTGRFLINKMYQARYSDGWMQDIIKRFVKFARDNNYSPASLAIAWAASHPAVTAPIIGARNLDQLNDTLQSLKIKMTPKLRETISSFSIEPPLATDRMDERTANSFGVR